MARIRELFDASPGGVRVTWGRKGLMPWEGAATWIEEGTEGRTCSIQINTSFASRLYPQEELIAHEMVHALRCTLDENRFEEILAYRTSKNRFRRYFGPLFSQPRESKIFVLLLLGSWLLAALQLFFDLPLGGGLVFLLPLASLARSLYRLIRSQSLFSLALGNLEQLFPGKGLSKALYLTDAEIALFARSSPEEIRAWPQFTTYTQTTSKLGL
jgi:hypothetical protein